MSGEKFQLEPFYATLGRKRLEAKVTPKEINDLEGSRTVNERMTQNWFKHFK